MNNYRNIDSLTNFRHNTPDFLKRSRDTGEPVVLTINGKAERMVQDAKFYQKLKVIAERAEEMEWLRITVEEMKAAQRNNAVERALRYAVICRRISGEIDREEESRFVERMFWVLATCRQQRRSVLKDLTKWHRTRLNGLSSPSLLPSSPTAQVA